MGEIIPVGCPFCCEFLFTTLTGRAILAGEDFIGTLYQNEPPGDPCGFYGNIESNGNTAYMAAVFCLSDEPTLYLWVIYEETEYECYVYENHCEMGGCTSGSVQIWVML